MRIYRANFNTVRILKIALSDGGGFIAKIRTEQSTVANYKLSTKI